jgi:hypothetical protein
MQRFIKNFNAQKNCKLSNSGKEKHEHHSTQIYYFLTISWAQDICKSVKAEAQVWHKLIQLK